MPATRAIHTSTVSAAVQPFKLTDIGEGIAEVELLQVYVKPGDVVQQYDKLVEVQSDKATVDISSPFDGVVKEIAFKPGDTVKTGSVLLYIDSAADPEPAAAAPAPAAPAVTKPTAGSAKTVVKPFNLTDIGEGIAEVELLEVYVKPGDAVQQYDKLVHVQSDKAAVNISSPFDGIIQTVNFKAGDIIKTGSTLLTVAVPAGDSDEAAVVPSAVPSAAGSVPAPLPSATPAAVTSGKNKALATPAVRRIAKEHNVDIAQVPPTGPQGRVLKGDILAFIAGKGANVEAPQASVARPAPLPVAPPAPLAAKDVVVPVKGIQRAMAKSMTTAWSVPHFGYSEEVSMDALIGLRRELKDVAAARGIKLSYLPVIIKAASLALKTFPQLNATTDAGATEVTYRASHNIGVAMDTPRGLIVPNIKAVHERSLFEIAEELNRLQELGSQGKLGESDLTGGTFTLSNIGAIGGTYTSPVLMMPQVVIGALGKVQRVPRYLSPDSDTIVPAHIMNVSWSGDHRVVDGATMARFSNLWKSYLENPKKMLLDMK